jgi:hypothetical protein
LVVPPDVTNVVAVGGAYFGWLALKGDGTVYDAFKGDHGVPPGLSNVVAIAGSPGSDGHVNLALKADGTVVGWGYDYFTGPVPANLSNVAAISAGADHNLALVGAAPPVLHVQVKPELDANGVSVSVPTRSGRTYRLEYTSSLSDGIWTGLPLVAGTGKPVKLADASPGGSTRFYRVKQW